MTLVLRRSAPLEDLAAMFEASPPCTLWKGLGPRALAARYCCYTRHWAAFAGERCVAAGGLYSHLSSSSVGRLEAWFACRPEASSHMVSLAKQARLTLRLIADAEHVEIFARVAQGWKPGQRLARALGFQLKEAGPVERWVLCPT